MRRIVYIILSVFLANTGISLNAQIADGQQADSFNVEDIWSVEHNLDAYLAQDLVVFLEFFTADCVGCFAYHELDYLNDVYTLHGPDGDNTARVIKLEVDADTNNSDLYGTGPMTVGNWIGSGPDDLPIVDNAGGFGINYLGTSYTIPNVKMICQDGTIWSIPLSGDDWDSAQDLMDYALSQCGYLNTANGQENVEVIIFNMPDTYCGEISPNVSIKNGGEQDLTSCTLKLYVNDILEQTINWTGNLSTGIVEDVQFDDVAVAGDVDLRVEASMPNGENDDVPGDNELEMEILGSDNSAIGFDILYSLTCDQLCSETSWELFDSDGDLLQWGNNYSDGSFPNVTNEEYNFELPGPDCYQFVIYDTGGNGMTNNIADTGFSGTLIFQDEQMNQPVYITGNWGFEETVFFDAGEASAPTIEVNVLLEGYIGSNNQMKTSIAEFGVLPMMQPFTEAPFNYDGNETLPSIDENNHVDWVLLDLRNKNNEYFLEYRKACILHKDGTVTDVEGNEEILFEDALLTDYMLVVHHPGHISIMTAEHITLGTAPVVDFTQGVDEAKGVEQQKLHNNKAVMIVGDADSNSNINNVDFNFWAQNSAAVGIYQPFDFDGNAISNVSDFNLWLQNRSKVGYGPAKPQ